MEPESAPFSLAETVNTVWQAALAVICHILFDAALHGFVLAFCIGMAGFLLRSKKHKFGRPLLAASRKLAILCIGVSIPGALTIAFTGGLPDTGNYSVHSIGFIVFWSMVSVHLVGEEMNYQWFIKGDKDVSQSKQESQIQEKQTVEQNKGNETSSPETASKRA